MVRLFRKIRLFARKEKGERQASCRPKIKSSQYTSVESSSMSTTTRNNPKTTNAGLKQTRYRKQKKQSPIDFDSLPIIDRVPTAIGYQSSCSEEEADDSTPRSSRYRIWKHEEELFQQNDLDDYDYISATDDRYSIFEGLESLSSDLSSSVHDSVSSIEFKIGHELHRQRIAYRDNIIRLAQSTDLSGSTEEARGTLARLEHCFSTTKQEDHTTVQVA